MDSFALCCARLLGTYWRKEERRACEEHGEDAVGKNHLVV